MGRQGRHEGILAYADGWYTLVRHADELGRSCVETHPCGVGETLEVWVDDQWQQARMACGRYRGRYLMLPDGCCVRPAVWRVLV